MKYSDIFKKAFLEGYSSTDINAKYILITLAVTGFIGIFIFFIYRLTTRKTFYSKTFSISIVLTSLITAAIIFTIQSNIVISLGMVGALSIVRFRAAIKDPLDLAFIYWSISVGIICGAGLSELAIILSLAIAVVIIILQQIPIVRVPMILLVNASDICAESEIVEKLKKVCKYYKIKSRNISSDKLYLIIEIRTKSEQELIQQINMLKNIDSVSLVSHDGDVTL